MPELMVKPEQRKFMYKQIAILRDQTNIYHGLRNDGQYAGGCIAGGKRHLHINANQDIEPCAFIHYSVLIYMKKHYLKHWSPLFMQYHDKQPFNKNHLRPCPLLDNPECLVDMVEKSGAKSTDMRNPDDVHSLSAKMRRCCKDLDSGLQMNYGIAQRHL